jgi:hypothetical protein
MTIQADPAELIGVHVAGIEGEAIGPIEQVFAEDRSGMGVWVRVRTGLFGNKHRFIPLAPVQRSKRGVKVPFTKQQIKDGPEFDADRHLSAQQVAQLALYYGVIGATAAPAAAHAIQIPAQRGTSAPSHLRTH